MGMQTRCCAFDWKSCKRFKLFLMIYNEDTYTYVCAYNVNEFQNVYNSPARDDDFNGLLWKNKIKFFNLKNTTYLVFKRFECFNMFCDPRSPSPAQPSPHGPPRTHPPPYPHRRTSARTHACVHQIELVVDAREHLGDGSRVAEHAHSALHLGEVAAGHNRRGLVVDAALEASGHQSTNWIVRFVLITAPRRSRPWAPRRRGTSGSTPCTCRGGGRTSPSCFAGSNTAFVISATDSCSWYAFSAEITGAYEQSIKWMRGYGTRLVWNSVMSTLSAPSKRSDAVSDDTPGAIRRFRFCTWGAQCRALRRHMS
jgi:hypothetical protein